MTRAGWRPWAFDPDEQVTCIACGDEVARDDAREYDKHGDRWSRDGKQFEYLCKPCYRECCHQNRDGLEEKLVAADAGRTDQRTFLRRFCERAADDAESRA
ncbi:hypothetical protein [Haloarchaeobius sp. FL176]|uniref:DUF7562 family protein n=1 Tax=Haloarchaeobius sp. FL176 TaxID=2967129 RepID=UPI002147F03B|nr:hypothetical protein [Haloarchaeobius sp. FL176]